MILKKFYIEEQNLKYFVGINQIYLDYRDLLESNHLKNEKDGLDFLISLASQLSNKFEDIILQFIDDNLILNEEHIFKSIYFVLKAFKSNINISNGKSMEVLLYLSTQRQIKKSIEAFGVNVQNLKNGNLTYLIASHNSNLEVINEEILHLLNGKDADITINSVSREKIKRITEYYNITNNEIATIINSYNRNLDYNEVNSLELSKLAIHDILCEKMAKLSLEKIKSN